MNSLYETNIGTILPSEVKTFKETKHYLEDKFIVFQTNNCTYKGTVKWYGEINNITAFGIETVEIDMGTNGEFNGKRIFQCKDECGILIKDSVKYLEIDELHGFVNYDKFEANESCTNSKSRLVYVKYKSECRIGRNLNGGYINGIKCFHVEILKESIKYFFIESDIINNFVNDDGIVLFRKDAVLNIESSNEGYSMSVGKRVCFRYENKNENGILKWKGKIDGLKCIGVYPNNKTLISDWKIHFNTDAYWTVICLDFLEDKGIPIMFEVEDPFDHDIFTYLKIKTYVKINNYDGIIISYFIDKKNIFYEIEIEEDDLVIIANSKDVKYGAVAKIDREAFVTMTNPNDYGVMTQININNHVEVKSHSENKLDKSCSGIVVWMGFDRDSTLKFLINLDDPFEHASGGSFYGQKLYNIKNKHGLLVNPDYIIPFGHVPGKGNPDCPKESNIVEQYQIPRSTISCGENKGIQGDKNSCYMDTSFFAMFTFQTLFDNLLINPKKTNQEIVNVLRSKIIFPLRKHEYVSFNRVSEFRKILGELFPDKKFLHSEKDPEELLETLFHLLTPQDPLLRTFDISSKHYQNCFMTQLFYTNRNNSHLTTIKEMLDRTFLESGILIDKPPKCLILQLPRHGTQFKQYSEVDITPTLDITDLICCGFHKCSQCTHNGTLLCLMCSEGKQKFIYFCTNHKTHCTHDKNDIINTEFPHTVKKVTLELFAILCIEKTHYVAYVKTGEVLDKWIYYDSMATSDKNILKPLIRDTSIGKYFSNKSYQRDVYEDYTRIKKFAFVCFYKNPSLEYYYKDYNHVPEKTSE